MYKTRQILPMLLLSVVLTACAGNAVAQMDVVDTAEPTAVSEVDSKTCPATVPSDPVFIPPAPYDSLGFKGDFWYGSEGLWTSLPQDGVWAGLPRNPDGFTQKIFWWRDGYVWNEEPEPILVVTGERLDGQAPPLNASRATNAYADDIGSAMLVGVDFPTEGCWQITGQYGKAELSFVIRVVP